MNHSFNTEVAEKYGVDEAIMLENIAFWINKNEANRKHFYDNDYWTYNSTRAFTELFPYWTERQIQRILKSLEEKNLVKTGNYNKVAYDRTKWYGLTQISKCIYAKRQMEIHENVNGITEKVEPIPYINTVINSNINTDTKTNKSEIENFFEECWKLYPNKLGKGSIKEKKKKEIFNLGEQFKICIKRYIENKESWRKYQNGSTFFNSGYVDYLNNNFKEQSKDYVKQQSDKESEEKYGF